MRSPATAFALSLPLRSHSIQTLTFTSHRPTPIVFPLFLSHPLPSVPHRISMQSPAATSSPTASLSNLLLRPTSRRYVFVTAKGGCGKTTTASAMALRFADEGLDTLVISVDPAHSLGDALNVDLSDGKVRRLEPGLPLWALEVDTDDAVKEFREIVGGLNVKAADGEALKEMASILDTVPPGADELISLIQILDVVEKQSVGVDFKRVVIDCAPTGHTLRLLSFPDFLDTFLTRALGLRKKLDAASGVVGNVAKIFAKDKSVDVNAALDAAAARVEQYRDRMVDLSDMLRDPGRAEFVVLTIPTIMAVSETGRLVDALLDDGIWVRHAVANMVVPAEDAALQDAYLRRLRAGQAREMRRAEDVLATQFDLDVTPVYRFDAEVRGVFALRALAMSAFNDERLCSYGSVFESGGGEDAGTQFVFSAGKGGVGKTSVACTMGVALADRGLKTLVISTDPAHSLGDSLDMSFTGGEPVLVENTNGCLYGMEIDTEAEVAKFKATVKAAVSEQNKGVGADIAKRLGLGEFADLLDNAPPGLDEALGLSKLLDLVEDGDYDRVIVDTAPTGHALRLMRFPDFLEGFFGKLISLKKRLDSTLSAIGNVFGADTTAGLLDSATVKLGEYQKSMAMLRDLILDGSKTQFVCVTIPTGLAMAESERLITALKKDGVRIQSMIVNQVIADDSASAFVSRVVRGQETCLSLLHATCDGKEIHITQLPFFDTEVRGLPALRALGMVAFAEKDAEAQ